MSFVVTTRPQSQSFAGPSASSPLPGFAYSPQKRPAVRSHYRPYSTLYEKDEAPPRTSSHRDSVLSKARRHSTIHRSISLGDVMGLGKKKALEKETTSKEKPPAPRIRELSDIAAETETKSTAKEGMSRPSTSAGGLTVAERSHINGKGSALHRVKAQRSIGSLFTAAADVSPNAAILEHTLSSRPSALTPPNNTFRPRKMDVVSSKRPRTASSPRPRRPSKADDDSSMKRTGSQNENDVWLTRSRTRVHPFAQSEVPYMQSYDIPCFDNDRYTELLLERMNPGSPSFWDYGRKYPLMALDLGCGQGDWCIYASSIWRHSRIFGLDIIDITVSAFQSNDNLKFVQGNFLATLPFPDKTFDFVRMANLSLCIPYDKWMHVLNEVRRVMTNNGRLELIDDQMVFPYGEEPHAKEAPAPEIEPEQVKEHPAVSPRVDHRYPQQGSFFDTLSDSDMESMVPDDDDTLETSSTASTLVSERDSGYFDKLSSKRSSAQSNASTSVGSERRLSDIAQPLSIALAANVQVPIQSTISPSPTITQATLRTLDPDASTVTVNPTQSQPVRRTHKKSNSASSTKSNTEAIASWKTKKIGCTELETIFEHILIERYGIHPRPAEFLEDSLQSVFGPGACGKSRSFHIKLAPFDSPIGPGGALSIERSLESAISKDKKSKRDKWDAANKKDKKWERRKVEKGDSPRGSIDEVLHPSMAHPGMLNQKAASRLGLTQPLPNAPPPRRYTEGSGTGSTSPVSATSKRSSASFSGSSMPTTVTAKAANRLGIPVAPPPVPPKSEAIVNSYVKKPNKRFSDPRPQDNTMRFIPRQNASASKLPVTDTSSVTSITPTNSFRATDQMGRTGSHSSESSEGGPISLAEALRPGDVTIKARPKPPGSLSQAISSSSTNSASSEGSTISLSAALRGDFVPEQAVMPQPPSRIIETYSSSSSSSNSTSSVDSTISLNAALRGDFTPPQLSAKAAGRLGVKYSILAAASATHRRSDGVMVPVQSPGILVWPSTYIHIPPAELEMHSCKWVQTLLGCRHALREYITGSFDGAKLVDDEEFDQTIWDYECFRRSRFHWPNDNPELFEDDGFPEPPSPTSAPNPSREQGTKREQEKEARLSGPGVSRTLSVPSFNGQYRRRDLTHVRTIRVFHAQKNVEDKSFVQMLFPNHGR